MAHILAAMSTLLLLAFMFGGGEHFRPTPSEAIALALFPGGVIVGFAVAIWREELGGWITIASLMSFFVYMFALSGKLMINPYFLLFAAPGFIHAANAFAERIRRSA